jgi:hypothetical protein
MLFMFPLTSHLVPFPAGAPRRPIKPRGRLGVESGGGLESDIITIRDEFRKILSSG